MEIGQYGTFNGAHFILLEIRGDKGVIIGQHADKKQVSLKNFKPVQGVCRKVYFNGIWYLITKTNRIISLLSNKFMRWPEGHPIREQILNTHGIQNARNVMANHQFKLPL